MPDVRAAYKIVRRLPGEVYGWSHGLPVDAGGRYGRILDIRIPGSLSA
ncbi:hypothetical protein [Candidatus Protofrankia californiensis]|nr:hypothetical protein [Candidatus Protofrankia californiensis]